MFSDKLKRSILILFVALGIIIMGVVGIILGYNYVLSQSSRMRRLEALSEENYEITKDTPGARPFRIYSGDTISDIADNLAEQEFIDNVMAFKIISKYNGFDGSYEMGTHYLTMDLSYDEIMFFLTKDPKTVTVTFTEGFTYMTFKKELTAKGIEFDETVMDELMNSPDDFVHYDFIANLKIKEDRDYILSGYLFPDTYTFDVNASEKSIINTLLRNTNRILNDTYYERAEYLGMTMDEVVTLASLIEDEAGKIREMVNVSSVFHNRLNDGELLQSTSTVNYIRELEGLPRVMGGDITDIERDHPYNSYLHPGLPPGPICMPGERAIQAALYPNHNNYYYFVADGRGNNMFSVTLSEHEAKRNLYEPLWELPREEIDAILGPED